MSGSVPLVLDAAGLSAMAASRPPEYLRALLAEAVHRDRDVLLPTVVIAEVCRGAARTRSVEAVLARAGVATVTLVDTDVALAKQVGAVLHAAGRDSTDMVDAHVVAVCVPSGGGTVVTSDSDDIVQLADALPNVRVVTRRPDA